MPQPLSRTELADSLGISPKTVDRLRGTVFHPVNEGEHRPMYDLTASVQAYAAYQRQKKRDKQSASVDGSDELLESVLRRWQSKVRLARQKLAKLDSELISFEELTNLWSHIKRNAVKAMEAWPERVAEKLVGVEDIPKASEILRQEVYSLLQEIQLVADLGEEDEAPPWETK